MELHDCLAATALLLATLLLGPGSLTANEPLQVLDAELGAETVWFAPHRWQGRSAVSAYTRRDPPLGAAGTLGGDGKPSAPEQAVQLVVLDAAGWRVAGRWALPAETRYVEPMRLPGGRTGWLLLVGAQWQVALPQGAELQRSALCTCETIFSHGGAPDPDDHRFVHDLDGDGTDEVLLPYSAHLEAYRVVPSLLAAEPLWRARWHPDETPLPRAGDAGAGFRLPRFGVVDVQGDGRPELLVVERDRALVTPLPDPRAAGDFALDGARRALLERRTREDPLPDTLAAALRRVGERRFATAEAFVNALTQGVPPVQSESWAPSLLRVLTLARSEVPVVGPYAVPLAGLGTWGEKDRPLLLGAADMDGDGVLDLLHAKLINYGSVLSQQNELRWYRGLLAEGRLAFAPPTDAVHSDAGSFAELVRLRRNGTPPLALLMATAEVSLGTIMKALANQSVTLQASVLPWRDGALAPQPLTAAQFTYRDLRVSGRRAMFLFADLNGDGWRDYLLNVNADALTVFLSADGPAGLQQPSLVQPGLSLPSKPERVLVTDLDGDGREELVLRYREKFHNDLSTKLRLVRLPGP